ncbi:MAG: Gfo/Idh/MocA family oxidoreductase, partial [Chitinophagales bacterium]|nr:Gfo/Idh/MocA family oxidoreductase [Chitinophagales bacterium]
MLDPEIKTILIIIIPVFLGLLILYVVRDFLQNKNEIERLKFLRTNPDQSLKFAKIQDCELVAICDVDGNKAKAVADEVGSQAESDYKKLLGRVDAVMVATPTTNHYEVAKFFLQNGVHV